MIRLCALAAVLAAAIATSPLPANDKPRQAKAPVGALTAASLLSTLDDMELKPKELGKGLYLVEIDRDDYRVFVRLSLSGDGRFLYLATRGAEITRPAEMPASFWRRLLTANDASSSSQLYFSYLKALRVVELSRFLPNRGMTAVTLRMALNDFHAAVKKQDGVWKQKEPAFVPIKDSPADARARAALQGTWRSTEVVNAGRTLTDDQIKADTGRAALEIVFDEKGGTLKLKADEPFVSRIGPSAGLMTFYAKDTKRMVHVRYTLDGDTLTVCLDPTGMGFPPALDSTAGNGYLAIKLKRVKP